MRICQVVILVAIALVAAADAITEVGQAKMIVRETSAWDISLVTDDVENKRFLRSETAVSDEEAEEEERVMPGTAAAEKLVPKLQKALSNKQLVSQKEETQFSLWFITGRAPSYVAENILKVSPLASTGKAIGVYHRYVAWFNKYFFKGGIRFHTN